MLSNLRRRKMSFFRKPHTIDYGLILKRVALMNKNDCGSPPAWLSVMPWRHANLGFLVHANQFFNDLFVRRGDLVDVSFMRYVEQLFMILFYVVVIYFLEFFSSSTVEAVSMSMQLLLLIHAVNYFLPTVSAVKNDFLMYYSNWQLQFYNLYAVIAL